MYRLNPVQTLKSRSPGEIGGGHLDPPIHKHDLDGQSLIRRHRSCTNKHKMAGNLGSRDSRLIVYVHPREVRHDYRCRDPDNRHDDYDLDQRKPCLP
jgi:hypothetical protein